MAERGLYIKLRKKFQGIEFMDFYKLATKVSKYEELLSEDNHEEPPWVPIGKR